MRGINARAAGTRVLLVDNYSSFTFNLYQYLAELTGVLPQLVRNDCATLPDLESVDAVVLSPGPGRPEKDRDFGICKAMLELSELPVLGVCLGHQGLGVSEGAILQPLEDPVHGRASDVIHSGAALFEGIPTSFRAIRYHSLALVEPLPNTLECIARTAEGQVMALRHRDKPHWGVQFHPESIRTEFGRELLANFCAFGQRSKESGASGKSSNSRSSGAKKRAGGSKKWRSARFLLEQSPGADVLFERLFGASSESFWLDGTATQGLSYLGSSQGPRGFSLRYRQQERRVHFAGARTESLACESIFDFLEGELAQNEVVDPDPEHAFVGGYVGYFGYELKEEAGSPGAHASDFPDAHWIWADRYVVYDHAHQRATLVMLVPEGESQKEADAWFLQVQETLAGDAPHAHVASAAQEIRLRPRDSREQYMDKIALCQEHIAAGESYELCLTTQWHAELSVDALALFAVMREQNPAPYAAYLRCGDFAIASASPECFLKLGADRWVQSKPIKGTSRRDQDEALDLALAEDLRASEKEQAENLMIVDLVRNDLGKNCEIGSVEVTSLAAIESFATVHQLVSTIGGKVREDVSTLRAVRDAFPGGSMTGAPKLRSMELLDSLEGAARGPYAGSIGFLGCDGAVDLSIVIRSAIVEDQQVRMGVGGAITALSQSEQEYGEMQLKASAQLRALQTLVADS